jgi:Ca2+-binding RTX toxin-like protein
LGRRQLLLGGILVLLASPDALAAAAASPAPTPAPVARSVWFYEVDAAAMPEARFLLDRILDHLSPANRERMGEAEVRIHIVPQDQDVTELPLWSTLRGLRLPDVNPADSYQETRSYDDVRGLGPAVCVSGPLNIAIGEELIVWLPGGRHPSPSPEHVGWSLVHEIGHAVACSLNSEQAAMLTRSYEAARRRPLSEVVGSYPSYTVGDEREYIAEGTAAWFESGPNETYRREWLAEHDPGLHELLSDMFTVPSPAPSCFGRRATSVLAPSDGPFAGTPGPDVVVGSDGDDVVNGGGGADLVCGGPGNDTLVGGYGDDRLAGEHGDDRLVDLAGGDQLVGGAGDDSLDTRDLAQGSPDQVDGSEGTDTCRHDGDDRTQGCEPPPPATTTTVPASSSTVPSTVAGATTTTSSSSTSTSSSSTVPSTRPGDGTATSVPAAGASTVRTRPRT